MSAPAFAISVPDPIDSSPQNLAVPAEDEQREGPKGRVKRVMEKTVDKLGRSITEKTKSPASATSGPRRFFSRKKNKTSDNVDGETSSFMRMLPSMSKLYFYSSSRCRYLFRNVYTHPHSSHIAQISGVCYRDAQR